MHGPSPLDTAGLASSVTSTTESDEVVGIKGEIRGESDGLDVVDRQVHDA